jgi:hypothetical protein
VADLAAMQIQGDKHGMVDALMTIGGHTLMFEYDGGHWHTLERGQHDEDKTIEVLARYPTCNILRVRMIALPLPRLENNERCTLVHIESVKHMQQGAVCPV